jgi:hypothetical protein
MRMNAYEEFESVVIEVVVRFILTPWLESANELYRQSDSHSSAKLVPTFADREVSHGQCGGSPTAVISISIPGSLYMPSIINPEALMNVVEVLIRSRDIQDQNLTVDLP